MLLNPDTFNEVTWGSIENTTPRKDLLSRKDDHPLFWAPTFSYIPIRSIFEYPVIAESDLGTLFKVIEYNCHLFNLSNPEEERLLRAIKDRIYSGWYVQISEETKWDKDDHILVWLTWAQQYLELPKNSDVNGTNLS